MILSLRGSESCGRAHSSPQLRRKAPKRWMQPKNLVRWMRSPSPDDQPVTLDGPATCIGQKQKTKDLQAILEVCIYGQAITNNKISSGEDVTKCKSTASGWVSQMILQKNSLITEIVSSTIDNV